MRGSASRPQDWVVGRIWILTGRSSPRLHAAGSALGVEIIDDSAPERHRGPWQKSVLNLRDELNQYVRHVRAVCMYTYTAHTIPRAHAAQSDAIVQACGLDWRCRCSVPWCVVVAALWLRGVAWVAGETVFFIFIFSFFEPFCWRRQKVRDCANFDVIVFVRTSILG